MASQQSAQITHDGQANWSYWTHSTRLLIWSSVCRPPAFRPFRLLKIHRQPCGARSLPLPLGRLYPLRRGLWPLHLAGDRHRSPLRTSRPRYPAPTGNPKHAACVSPQLLLLRHQSTSCLALASDPTARQSHLFRWMNFETRSPACNGCRPTLEGSGRSGSFGGSPLTICTSCGGSCTRRRICS